MRAPRPALPKKKGLPTSPSGPGGVKSESHSCHVFKGAFTLVYLLFSHSPDSLDGKLKSRAEKGLAPHYTSFLVADPDRLSLDVHM